MNTAANVNAIVVSADLTLEDWRALQRAAAGRLSRSETERGQWLRVIGLIALFAVATVATLTLLDSRGLAFDAMSLLAGASIVVVAMVVNSRIALRRMAPAADGNFLGPCTFDFDSDGLRSMRRGGHSFMSWNGVFDVTHTDKHVFVWTDRLSAYVIPGHALPAGITVAGLFEWIAAARAQQREAAAVSAEPAVPLARPQIVAAGGAPTAPRRPPAARLVDLASLVALRGKAVLTEPSQSGVAALATLLAVGTWVAINRWQHGPGASFYVYGVPNIAWYLLGGLVVAWLLAWTSTPRIALARAVVVSAVGACLVVLYSNLGSFVGFGWVSRCLFVVVLLYALVYLIQATRALTGQVQPRAVLAAFGATVAFLWSTEALFVFPNVWMPSEAEREAYQESWYDIEPLLFAQRERVDAALAAVPQSDASVTELFFVGFAGFGEQRVFAEEIKFADRVVAQRYPHRAGSVLLLNDARDFDSAPLATASTLRHALRGVAQKMTLDDDILFLALSSHGSSDWELSVANGSLPLLNLSAEDLAAALDEAGIQWRVIVISACYAGGFIEALENPFTIVLAAAAPDRTSFGCSDERELTYFGEAFYRDALPTAESLRAAFATAERLVLDREAAEGIATPSQPTAFFGAEIERRLAALE